jgi:hypothetical protein
MRPIWTAGDAIMHESRAPPAEARGAGRSPPPTEVKSKEAACWAADLARYFISRRETSPVNRVNYGISRTKLRS